MMMIKRCIILILIGFSLFSHINFAQRNDDRIKINDGTIMGKVQEVNSSATIEYVNVVLLNNTDGTVVTGTVTDEEGNFKLTNIQPKEYFLEFRFIGFSDKRLEVDLTRGNIIVDLGIITLEPTSVNLEDVVVEGQRTPVSYKIDKKVVDVSQMQTVVSGNAADILENVPSVTVDIEGNVSLRGSSNFTVLVDGRPSIINEQDALQQIPATSIETIEIITNPSAKFDPEGSAGIINIIMKKNHNNGLSGIVNLNGGLKDKYGGDFIFDYKTETIKYNFGLDYNRRFHPGDRRQENIFTIDELTSFVNSDGNAERGRLSFGLRGGLELHLGDYDIVSFGGRYRSRRSERTMFLNYAQWTDADPDQYFYNSRGERERSGTFYSLNGNYTHKFGLKDHEIYAELFFGHHNSDEYTLSAELENNIQFDGKETTESGPSDELGGKIDYTLPLSENSKFSFGSQGEIDISEENTGLTEFDPDQNKYIILPEYTNSTNYNRSELAIYSMYSNTIDNFGFQGGIRSEYTYQTVELLKEQMKFSIDRWDFFPSVHTSYKFDDGTQLMASYSRRIQRPRGWQLEPFVTWMDANNLRMGNPALKPELIDSYEMGVQTFFGETSLSGEVYYRFSNDKIERIHSAYDENVTLHTVENVGKDYSLGAEFMFVFDLWKFWNTNLIANIYNYKVEGSLSGVYFSRKSFNWNARLNNSINISKSTQLQFNARYNSPSVSSQGRWEGFFSSDFALRQDFLDKMLSVTVQVRDVFGTSKHEFTSESDGYYSYVYFNRESPMVLLNLRFNFNHYKTEKPTHNGEMNGGDEGEDF